MQILIALVTFLFTSSWYHVDASFDFCGACNAIVSILDEMEWPTTSESDALAQMNKLCDNIPQEMETAQQCRDFVRIYGSYAIDLFLTQTSKDTICMTLGLCEDPKHPEASSYEIILPRYVNDKFIYNQKVVQKSSQLHEEERYRVFLGKKENFPSPVLSISTHSLQGVKEIEFHVQMDDAKYSFTDSVQIHSISGNVWVYLKLNTTFASTKGGSFTLLVEEFNDEYHTEEVVTGILESSNEVLLFLPVIGFMAFGVLCLVLCCICAAGISNKFKKVKKEKKSGHVQLVEMPPQQMMMDPQHLNQVPGGVMYYYPYTGTYPPPQQFSSPNGYY